MSSEIERLLNKNPQAPHRVVIWIQAEVHELLKTGECHGSPVEKVGRFPIYFDGADRYIAIRKMNEFLAELKEKTKSESQKGP